jgi:hypothetical protein
MQHFNVPAESVDEDFFVNGQMFDGSSIRGFQAIHESDMKLIPDPATAYVDSFRKEKTLALNFSIVDPFTDEPYSRDPRNIAAKAEAYLKTSGVADTAYFGPEAEFYVFDDVRFETKQNAGYYYIDSIEGAWNSGRVEEGGNRGYKTRYKGGYFPVPPVDHYADLRDQMSLELGHHVVAQVGEVVDRRDREVAALVLDLVAAVAALLDPSGVPRAGDGVDRVVAGLLLGLEPHIVEDVELRLRCEERLVSEAGPGEVGLGLARNVPRIAGVRLAGQRVVDEARHVECLGRSDRVDGSRGRVGDQRHVRLMDGLEATDRRAVEHESGVEQVLRE